MRWFQALARLAVSTAALAMSGPALAGAGPASAPLPGALSGGGVGQGASSAGVTTSVPPPYDSGAATTTPFAAPAEPAPAPTEQPLAPASGPARPPQVIDPDPVPPGAVRPGRSVLAAGQRATESYGGYIVVADITGLVLTAIVGNVGGSSINALVVVAPYLLASPLVHVTRGHPGLAAPSLVLHLTAPLLGLLTGFAIGSSDCNDQSFCGLGGAAIGFLAGMITATVVDAAVLAHNVPVRTRPAYRSSLTPIFSVARASSAGGANAAVGIAGRF